LGGYVLALVGSFGLAYTLLRKGHPRIDLGMKVLPRALHAPLHVLAQAVLAGIALFMTFHAWSELAGTIRFGTVTNTPLKTPLWVPQGLWVAGTATFALVAVTNTLHGLWLLARAPALVQIFYGTTSVQDELDEVIGATSHLGQKD
jgi:TRAP-type C4-dicarboxylate transport system permease small subunit